MKRIPTSLPLLWNRRQWLLAGLGALGGCGGGGSPVAGAPGTGGTGIGLQGTITGFGSVIINNTKFDDTQAVVRIDGLTAQTSDLRVGMVAQVLGQREGMSGVGQASSIQVWSVAMGAVSAIHGGGSFDLAGITVTTDAATRFDGLANAAAIQSLGMTLAIWGVQASADARTWKATRVAAIAPISPTVTTGWLQMSGATRSVNGFTLQGASANAIQGGQLVRAEGFLDTVSGLLTTTRVDVVDLTQVSATQANVEVGGVVTAYTDASHFTIGATPIDASQAEVQGNPQGLGLSSVVEALGVLRNGVLVASLLEIKAASELSWVDITGVVESTHYQGLAEFVVRGQECNALNAVIHSVSPVTFGPGVRVRVRGTSDGDEALTVTELYIGVP